METEKRFFFVLALPRSRTAWLSVLLSSASAFCYHEGLEGCENFAEYAAKLRARPESVVGDCNSLLPRYLPELLKEFPDATFVFIDRDPDEALQSLINFDPSREGELRQAWNGVVQAYQNVRFNIEGLAFDFADLVEYKTCADLLRTATGHGIDREKWETLDALRIEYRTDRRAGAIPPPIALDEIGYQLTPERLSELGFDLSGLTVRPFASCDYGTVSAWWTQRHGTEYALPESPLPPLGVIVEDSEGMAGALFCYESFGVGVGILEFPATRPGLTLRQAGNVMAFAVCACVQLAGQCQEPPGKFKLFRAATLPGIARFLERLGFVRADSGIPRYNLILKTA